MYSIREGYFFCGESGAMTRLYLTAQRIEVLLTTDAGTTPNLIVYQVTNIQPEGSRDTVELPVLSDQQGDARPVSTSALLDSEMALRIVNFARNWVLESCGYTAKRMLRRPPRHRRFYDCHSSTSYICRWTDSVRKLTRVDISNRSSPVTHQGLPYAIVRANEPTHSLLGWASDHSLSVLGNYGPLVVCHNADLMRAYGGDALRQIEYMQ